MQKMLHNFASLMAECERRYMAQPYEVPERVYYAVEPVVLGADGFVAFENPSRAQLDRVFSKAVF